MGVLDQDFELPTPPEPAPFGAPEAAVGAPTAAVGSPMVVIHYRGRGWFSKTWPAVFLLAAGGVGLYYRLKTPDWRGLGRISDPVETKVAVPVAPEPTPPAPLVVRVEPTPPPVVAPEPSPRVEVAPTPPMPGEVSPEVVAALESAFAAPEPMPQPPPLPPAEVAVAVVVAPPKADPRAIEADIRREAEAKQVEQLDLEALKRRAPAVARVEAFNKAGIQLAEEFAKNDADRRALLAEVQRAAKAGKLQAATIRELCENYDRSYSDNIRKLAEKFLDPKDPRGVARNDHLQRTRVARRFGLPEVVILEGLAKDLLKDHAARNGPTTADEALVRAAHFLLTVPLPKAPTAAAAAVPPGGPAPLNR